MTDTETHLTASYRGGMKTDGMCLIAAAVLLVWFPILGGYPAVADEHVFRTMGEGGFDAFVRNARQNGIWRSLGIPIQAVAATHSVIVPWLAILIHMCVCVLIVRLARSVGADRTVAFVAALLFGIFPFGYQCLVNTMCITMMISTAMLLGWLCFLLKESVWPGAMAMAVLAALVGFIAGCIYESLLFCFAVSGLAISLIRWHWDRRLAWATFGSAGGVALYLALYLLVPAPGRPMSAVFNPESLLGAWWWQWSNVWIFEPLLLKSARSLIFYDWGWWHVVAATLLGASVITLMARAARQGPESPSPRITQRWAVWAGIILLMLSASAVFVFVGYSTDTRKKYCLVPLAILALCGLISHFPAITAFVRRNGLPIVAGLIAMGAVTTWVLLGVYRFEITRHDSLLIYLRTRDSVGRVELAADASVVAPWPRMPRTLGFGFFEEWVLRDGSRFPVEWPLQIIFGPAGARYDASSRTWIVDGVRDGK